MAQRWAAVLDREVSSGEDGFPQIDLAESGLRFLPDQDGRGEGLAEIDIACYDPEAVLRAADELGLPHESETATLAVAGIRVRLRTG